MGGKDYYGKKEKMVRHYNSVKNFVGENRVYKAGDVLYISTRNNDEFDLIVMADGKNNFINLVKKEANRQNIQVIEEGDTIRIKVIED